jgi:ribosome-binding protein aMBF1 (putative translation factor)
VFRLVATTKAAKPAEKRTWRSPARSSPQVSAGLVRFGKRVRALRRERGLSQEEVAERAAVDPKHVQAIEHGRKNVTFATIQGVARALGVRLEVLFKGV